MSVEMAFERALARLPQRGASDRCYVCLEEGRHLLRGCACRGAAGFVHAECAERVALAGEGKSARNSALSWTRCITCRQPFHGALDLEMNRRWWRRHRDDGNDGASSPVVWAVAHTLDTYGESLAADLLLEERAETMDDYGAVLLSLREARRLADKGDHLGSLEKMEALLPRAERCGSTQIYFDLQCQIIEASFDARKEDYVGLADDCVRLARRTYGNDHINTHRALVNFSTAAGMAGRFKESRDVFEETLTNQKRTYGNDHLMTKLSKKNRAIYLNNICVKARHLFDTQRQKDAATYLEALMQERKTSMTPPEEEDVVDITFDMLTCLRALLAKLERVQDTRTVALESLAIAKRRYGSESPKTQTALLHCALATYDADCFDESISIFKDLLTIQTTLFGPEDSNTLKTQRLLMQVRQKKEKEAANQ